MQVDYEIHYIKSNRKQVIRISPEQMTELEAWKSAITYKGASSEETAQLTCLAHAKILAAKYHISSVRWNKAINVKILDAPIDS